MPVRCDNLHGGEDDIRIRVSYLDRISQFAALQGAYILPQFFAQFGFRFQQLEAFERALRLNPQFAEAQNNLGTISQREGKPEKALREYQEAIRIDPNYPEGHNNAANLYCLQKNFPEAIKEYKQALSLRPDYFEAQFGLAGLFLMQGDFAHAEEEYGKAHAINPEKVESALRQALDLNLGPVLTSEVKKILTRVSPSFNQ